jgi:hypothetical protein
MTTEPNNQIIIYEDTNGEVKLDVSLENETVWLSQKQLEVLFDRDQSGISRHLNSIFKSGELDKKSNMQKMHIANSDKAVEFYNLDVIVSVGYRVKSLQGTKFRQWATQHLKEFIIKGFTMDDERLKDPRQIFGKEILSRRMGKIRSGKTWHFEVSTPPDSRISELAKDYKAMEYMIFDKKLSFDDIMETLKELEEEINALENKA